MKLKDTYDMYKRNYNKYVIIIKCGSFYKVFGEECLIINNLFNYKIKKYSNSKRVGFPIIAYNKVTGKLNHLKINYIDIDENIIKKRFKNNNYDSYLNDLSIDERINKIYEKLNFLKLDSNINYILNSIEEIYEG